LKLCKCRWMVFLFFLVFLPPANAATAGTPTDDKIAVINSDRFYLLGFCSPGHSFAYTSVNEQDQWAIFLNENQISDWHNNVRLIDISSDCKAVAYTGCRKEKCAIFLNKNRVSDWFESVSSETLYAKGNSIVYGAGSNNKRAVFINNKKVSNLYDSIGQIILTDSDDHVAYVGKEGKWVPDVMNPDGSIFRGKAAAFLGQKQISNWYDYIEIVSIAPDNDTVTYKACSQGKCAVYKNRSVISPYYGGLAGVKISADNKTVAYGAMSEGKWAIYVNHKRISNQLFRDVGITALNIDGKCFAYVGGQGKWSRLPPDKEFFEGKKALFLNQKQVSDWFNDILEICLDDNGKDVIYKAGDDKNNYAIFYNTTRISDWIGLGGMGRAEIFFSCEQFKKTGVVEFIQRHDKKIEFVTFSKEKGRH